MNIREDSSTKLFRFFSYIIIILSSLASLLPFLLIISASLTSNNAITKYGYHFIPTEFSLEGYQAVFRFPEEVLRAYGVTIMVTVCGTLLGLFLMTMAGYVLSRKDFWTSVKKVDSHATDFLVNC